MPQLILQHSKHKTQKIIPKILAIIPDLQIIKNTTSVHHLLVIPESKA